MEDKYRNSETKIPKEDLDILKSQSENELESQKTNVKKIFSSNK